MSKAESIEGFELLLKREKRKARLYGMKISIQQRIRKTKRFMVWYAGEVVTFEYRGFIIDIGVFPEVEGTVLRNDACVMEFDTRKGCAFKTLLGRYLLGDAAVRASLWEDGTQPETKSKTLILVGQMPQVEVAIYDEKRDSYIANYFLGPANRISVTDIVKLADSFRKVIDDYADGQGKLEKVPKVVTEDIFRSC